MRYMGFRRNTINLLYLLSFAASTFLCCCCCGLPLSFALKMAFFGVCAFIAELRICSLVFFLFLLILTLSIIVRSAVLWRRACVPSQIKSNWWWYQVNANNQSKININSNKLIWCAVEVDGFLCGFRDILEMTIFSLWTRSNVKKKSVRTLFIMPFLLFVMPFRLLCVFILKWVYYSSLLTQRGDNFF